ncbi:lysophospholipid acyltransferase family protein [Thermostichus vulcanus]|uniref:lysophospholipid acyltransferase family protein n=1 Tax=Thermostichus vulcanus TaxID=32053 RepID=UPI001FCBCA4F|nr:lysophospholipid acyltransferase family protein [Thermostichus vulcanus]
MTRLFETSFETILNPAVLAPSWFPPLSLHPHPTDLAHLLLSLCQTEVWVEGSEQLPDGPMVVVSNHRSFLDAPVLIAGLGRPIRFACHYYLSQVPLLREIALGLGCIPLRQGSQRQMHFFRQAQASLAAGMGVGIFPEGAEQITRETSPQAVGRFQPGFAHLALASGVDPLPIVPVAVRVWEEWRGVDIPMAFFRWFDPTEPMFQQETGHPVVFYRRVALKVGSPLWLTHAQRRGSRRERLQVIQQLAAAAREQVQAGLNP